MYGSFIAHQELLCLTTEVSQSCMSQKKLTNTWVSNYTFGQCTIYVLMDNQKFSTGLSSSMYFISLNTIRITMNPYWQWSRFSASTTIIHPSECLFPRRMTDTTPLQQYHIIKKINPNFWGATETDWRSPIWFHWMPSKRKSRWYTVYNGTWEIKSG